MKKKNGCVCTRLNVFLSLSHSLSRLFIPADAHTHIHTHIHTHTTHTLHTHTHTHYTHIHTHLHTDTATENESFTASPAVCPRDIATFTCTVCDTTSSAATYWQVGGYTCLVLHSGIVKTNRCGPNHSFVAELKTDGGNCYRSMFNITAHLNLKGTTVRCSVEQDNRTVGHGNLEVIGEHFFLAQLVFRNHCSYPCSQPPYLLSCWTKGNGLREM